MKHYLVLGFAIVGLAAVGNVPQASAQSQPNVSYGNIVYRGALEGFQPPAESDADSCKALKGRAMVRHGLYDKGVELLNCNCVPHTGTWGKRKACSIEYTAQLNQKAYDHALALDEREKKPGRKGGSER